MAVDKAIDSTEFDSKLTTLADAIRTAGGTTATMSFPTGMVDAISSLSSGGGGTEELSALLKIFGCSDYEISVVQEDASSIAQHVKIPIPNETLKSSLRLIFIHGTNSLFSSTTVKKAPILRAPSTIPIYGLFAYMPPFVLLENGSNTTVALQYNGMVKSYNYTTLNSFTQDDNGGFVFENNILTIDFYFLCGITDADLSSMNGKKVLLMGGNVQ